MAPTTTRSSGLSGGFLIPKEKSAAPGKRADKSSVIGVPGMMILGLAASCLLLINWMIGPDGAKSHHRAAAEKALTISTKVEPEEAYQPDGWSGVEDPGIRGGGGESSIAGGLTAYAESIARELVSKVLEGDDAERREIATAIFLDDLEFNLAILRTADLADSVVRSRGRYCLEVKAPYQLPPRIDSEPGKAGTAQLLLVFMDGTWKLHELTLQ